jgi:hypothetical protein
MAESEHACRDTMVSLHHPIDLVASANRAGEVRIVVARRTACMSGIKMGLAGGAGVLHEPRRQKGSMDDEVPAKHWNKPAWPVGGRGLAAAARPGWASTAISMRRAVAFDIGSLHETAARR